MIEPELFKLGMRRMASSVSIVTTASGGARHGMVATAVSSVSADPPSMLVCVNRSASCHDPMSRSGSFCINLLDAADGAMARRFSSPEYRKVRFDGREWDTLVTGAPALVDALASFDCEVTQAVSVDSHTVYVGRVVAARLRPTEVTPLIYLDGRYKTIASAPAA